MNRQTPIVVVGGGISGISCIEQLAEELPETPLILVSASDVIKVVSNLKRVGQTLDEFTVEEETKHYLLDKYKNIEIITDQLIQLNAEKHELVLKKGQTIKYKKLCVCLGASPKQLPVSDSIRHTFKDYISVIRDTQTVSEFQNKLKNSKRMVIVGNGGIATELVHRVSDCQIIWCIKDDCYGAPYFDPMAAKFFSNQLNNSSKESRTSESNISKRLKYGVIKPNEDNSGDSHTTFGTALGPDWYQSLTMSGSDTKSVKIEYNCEVINIFADFESIDEKRKPFVDSKEPNVWPIFVELTNGQIYGCDYIVCAIGVVPNIEPVVEGNHFNIGTDGGLLVNKEMLTSEPDVYAAGDVCSVGWETSELWFQMRLWTQARQMGVYAALCMSAHINQTTAELYFNFDLFAHMTRFFSYKVVLLGLYNGQKLDQKDPNLCKTLVRVIPEKQFVKVILRSGQMVGAILVGETDLEETFENLILNQIDLSSYGDHLLDNTVDIDDYFD